MFDFLSRMQPARVDARALTAQARPVGLAFQVRWPEREASALDRPAIVDLATAVEPENAVEIGAFGQAQMAPPIRGHPYAVSFNEGFLVNRKTFHNSFQIKRRKKDETGIMPAASRATRALETETVAKKRHRTHSSRNHNENILHIPAPPGQEKSPFQPEGLRMGREGFEPSKALPTDLQSAPFDRSGISPRQVSYRQSLPMSSHLRDSNPRPRDYKSRALTN
jgi:hypothetical protein